MADENDPLEINPQTFPAKEFPSFIYFCDMVRLDPGAEKRPDEESVVT